MGRAAALVLAVVALGCDDDEGPKPSEQPVVEGPYAAPPALAPDARSSLGSPLAEIAPDAEAHFYWYDPLAGGETLRFELVAVAASPLEQGASIHQWTKEVPAGQTRGRLALHPRDFAQGRRRTAEGASAWVEGVYRLEALRGGEAVASVVFEVR